MLPSSFDRSKHVYHSDAFVELIKDAVRFFNGTPVHSLTPIERFVGTGVYALYYTGNNSIYQKYAELNRLSYDFPIYVGKAVPKGWRQSRGSIDEFRHSRELFSRLREHSRSIEAGAGLQLADFSCRFIIFEREGADMISTIEASLIKLNRPVWNSCLDGFGNHDPGNGRYRQARSDWDVVHPGRYWADRLTGISNNRDTILQRIETHLQLLRKHDEIS